MPTIAATEQRAGAALQAMITDESLTVSEAVQRCAGAISHREAARLRQLAAQAHNNSPRMTARGPPTFDDGAHKYCRRTWSFGQLPRQDAYARTPGRFRRLAGGRRRAGDRLLLASLVDQTERLARAQDVGADRD